MGVCNAVYFRLYIDLMHITPPVKDEGFDGSHHPRYAEWSKSGKFFDNCQVKNFNFSTFRGTFFARKVEVTLVSVPNFYFSSSS